MKKIDFRGKYGSAGSKEVYIARIQNALSLGSEEQSLIELLKASFGGDRSAAGRYAAEQRWKGNRKKEKPKAKRKKKQPDDLDPRLGKAIEILANNFGGDAIASLRKALAISVTLRDGSVIESKAAEPTAEEIRLAVVTEEVGRLIDAVIGEELKKLEGSQAPERDALTPQLKELQQKISNNNELETKFRYGFYEVSSAQYSSVLEQVEGVLPKITRPVVPQFQVNAELGSIQKAVNKSQTRIISKLIDGGLTYEQVFKLSDSELLALTEHDKSGWPSRGKKRENYDRTMGDDTLFLQNEDNALWKRADRQAAYLAVMRKQIAGDFGSYISREARKLLPAEERNKARLDLIALSTRMTASQVSDSQRHDVVKSVLSKVGVKFGEAGQVPVELQYKKTDEVLGRKVSAIRDAKETPLGQKFQGLIDDAVQLLPATLWKGSNNSTVQPSLDISNLPADAKYPVRVVLDIRNGRAHAQKIVQLQQPGYPSSQQAKLKLNSLKLNQPATSKWKSTALHEMGHAAEYSNSWLTQMENAYWTYRAKGESLSSLKKLTGLNYKSREKGVKDAWGEIYAGKNYQYSNSRSNAWEIFTTGIENIFYGGKADSDHRAFTLGLLALSTQIKD